MSFTPPPVQTGPGLRNKGGWIALAFLFILLIPLTVASSFMGSDPDSHSPSVQLDNLEAIVLAKSKAAPQTKQLDRLLRALPDSDTSEDAAMIRLLAERERGLPLGQDDLKTLSKSTLPNRQALAGLLAIPLTDKAALQSKVATLKGDSYPYRLAKAQALEATGDLSLRYKVSPELKDPGKPKVEPHQALLGMLVIGGLIAGVGILGWYVVSFSNGEVRWEGHPLTPSTLLEADALALRAAQFLLVFFGGSFIVGEIALKLFPGKTMSSVMLQEAVTSLSILIASLFVTKVPVMGWRYTLSAYGISKEKVGKSVLWGVGGFFASIPLVTVGLVVGSILEKIGPRPEHPLSHMLDGATSWWMIAIAFFLASFQAPITEELTFRGTLVPAFAGLWAKKPWAVPGAIAASSFLFASIHPQGFVMWLPLACVGAVNSVLCYQTRSVLPGMVMHALFNGSIITLMLLMK